ncbi:MAG: type II toxin-antitoxin system HipA family toxin [Proteobacteria bacterium]|nr:MAG: type II toxin-antitoxin system HipA family toxin [Pseudomonadota bacterium]
MAKKRNGRSLKVYLNNLPLGLLSYNARKSLSFTYLPEWLDRPSAFPISRCLPLREDAFEGDVVFAYFDNLLPDGVSIRQRMAARMSASSDQVFDLLAVVGRDCVGALQFIREDDEPPTVDEASGTIVTPTEIAEMLRNLRAIPLAVSQEDDFRLSIAGAQEKTAFLFQNGKWHVPHGPMPTTHIFKPQIGEIKPGLSFSDSVENEWLCAQIAQAYGLPTAECEVAEFDGVKVLVVKRFDRAWSGPLLIRIPQEDMCQALSIPNFKKYEAEGGPGILTIMELLNESSRRERDRRLFMKTQVVFFLLAAIDGHAKNFSLRWGPSGFNLTQLYDILSAQPMIDKGGFQLQKVKMAMAYGENRHYKIAELSRRHFEQTAKQCKFNAADMQQIIDEVIAETPKVIDQVTVNLPKDFPKEIHRSIMAGIRSRLPLLEKPL